MSVLYTNNAKTTLSASLNNSATSLSVASSSGFPSLSGSHYFYATLDDNTNLEVVKVTAVSGTTWTVERGQDNTSATAFSSGDTVELRLNAALLTDVVNDALASSFTRQDFTGDGSTTAFTLNKTPGSENDLIVFIEGVFQNQADYTLSGTTLTFDEAPASSRKIVVYHVSASVSGDSLALNTFSGDGSTTAFTMSVDPLYENNTMVFIDGVYQNKSTYSTSGTTLTFDAAPANGTAIDVTTHTQATVNVPVDGSVSTAKLAADAVTGAKIADDAIDSEHYTDGSIDTAHIGNLQVTTGKLAADAVTAAKLADDAVVTANITDDAVTTAKVADDQITLAKLAGLARGKIIYGDASGNPAALTVGSAGTVLTSDGTDISWAEEVAVNYLPLAGGTMTGDLILGDNVKLEIGSASGGDLQIYHDGSNSIVQEVGTGDLRLAGNVVRIRNSADTENMISAVQDGAVTLCFDGNGKLATTSTGIQVTGDISNASGNFTLDVAGDISLDADGSNILLKDGGTQFGEFENSSNDLRIKSTQQDKDIVFRGNDGGTYLNALTLDMSDAGTAIFNHDITLPDDGQAIFGAGSDLKIKHDGTHSYIQNFTGNLEITNNSDDKDIILKSDDGSGGLTSYITIDGSAALTQFDRHTKHPDNIRADFGSSSDLQLYHSGTNSLIDNYNGGLYLRNNVGSDVGGDIFIQAKSGENSATFTHDGAVTLMHDNVTKFATTSSGIDVVGTVELDNITVSGAQGSDGQVLTSTGSGIAWEDAAGGTAADDISTGDAAVTIGTSSGAITLDTPSTIKLDSDAGEVQFLDGGTEIGVVSMGSQNMNIESKVADKDIVFKGIDGSSDLTALTLDMSAGGAATFAGTVNGLTLAQGSISNPTGQNFAINTPHSLRINIDSNNDATDEVFVVGHNRTDVGTTDSLLLVYETGATNIRGATNTETFEHLNLYSSVDNNPSYVNMVFESGQGKLAKLQGRQIAGGSNAYGDMVFYTSNNGTMTENMRVMYNGSVLKPNLPKFDVARNAGYVTDDQNFIQDQVRTNVGSHYNSSNGRFTAPVAGEYLISFRIFTHDSGGVVQAEVTLKKNGGDAFIARAHKVGGYHTPVQVTKVITLAANDYIQTYVGDSGTSSGWMGSAGEYNYFSGFLIG